VLGDHDREVGRVLLTAQVVGRQKVAPLAVAAGLGTVGHLADHGLHEAVLPDDCGEAIGGQSDDLLAQQRIQRSIKGTLG
jgi:hypothetical protein